VKRRPILTEALARAAATDAGNASMRKAGRKAWSREDLNASVREFDRLIPFLPLEARLRLAGNEQGIVEAKD
jgi:hypothetical protein